MAVAGLLWIGWIVENKLLVALSTIRSQEAAFTEETMADVHQLLDYYAAYPENGIVYRASTMVLAVHSDTRFNNKSRPRSRACAHTLLSENGKPASSKGIWLTNDSCIDHEICGINGMVEAETTAPFLTTFKL